MNKIKVLTADHQQINTTQVHVGNEEHYFIAPKDVKKVAKIRMVCKADEWKFKPEVKWRYENPSVKGKQRRVGQCTRKSSGKGFCVRRHLVISEVNESAYDARFTCQATQSGRHKENRSIILNVAGELHFVPHRPIKL